METIPAGAERWLLREEIPRMSASDPQAITRIHSALPVVITDMQLVDTAVKKWSLEYLEANLGQNDVNVFRSSGDFLYFDDKQGEAGYAWTPPCERTSMPMAAFAAQFRDNISQDGRQPFHARDSGAPSTGDGGEASPRPRRGHGSPAAGSSTALAQPSPADSMLAALSAPEGSTPTAPAASGGGRSPSPPASPKTRVYMQQSLTEGVSAGLAEDFAAFNWPLANALASKNGWGGLTSNLLLVGEAGCVTPLHYDEQHNLFAQALGRKLAVVAAPEHFQSFYPFPLGHPHDRQAQVNARHPDTAAFPCFHAARFQHAILGPGDVLYIPSYWWHEIHSPWEDTVSVNFWYRAGDPGSPPLPLRDPVHLVALRRNIEKLMGQTYGWPVSTAFFARVGSGQLTVGSATHSDRDIMVAIMKLLTMVLAAEDMEDFVMTLARGRFDLPRQVVGGGRYPPKTPLVRAVIADAITQAMAAAEARQEGEGVDAAVGQMTRDLQRVKVTEGVRAAKQAQSSLGAAMGVSAAPPAVPGADGE